MSSNHDEHETDHTHAPEHGVETEGAPTTVAEARTPLRSFIWPAAIALIVLILIWGPVTGAFGRYNGGVDANGRPAPTIAVPLDTVTPAVALTAAGAPTPPNSPLAEASAVATPPLTTPTGVPAAATALPSTPLPAATPSASSAAGSPTPAHASPTPGAAVSPPSAADLANGAPRSVSFGGKTFSVLVSKTTAPEWSFSKDPSVASWARGTNTNYTINYILGVPYTPENAALFAAAHASDTITMTRGDGSANTYVVDQVQRVAPTDTSKMAQDHPAITLLLLGDPAGDRALVQGHVRDSASVP